jgi:hypothetical protein
MNKINNNILFLINSAVLSIAGNDVELLDIVTAIVLSQESIQACIFCIFGLLINNEPVVDLLGIPQITFASAQEDFATNKGVFSTIQY